MDTATFFDLIVPSQGLVVVATQTTGEDGRFWQTYRKYESRREAALAAEQLDQQGETVFFGVNSFGDWYTDEKTGKKRIRTQKNVVACRSLYDDLDVDPDKHGAYASREEARADIVRLAKAVRLKPTVVSSGGGYHVYFPLDEDITPAVWQELRALKRQVTRHLKMKVDPTAEKDISRVLRPVGTHNRKLGTARPVKLEVGGKSYPVDVVRDALQQYLAAHDVEPETGGVSSEKTPLNPFAAALGQPAPSDADIVAEHCAAVRDFRDTKGNIPEPHWYKALGVVKHCINGEDIVHKWSSGYDGYDFDETQKKIDQWEVGPTTCAEMDRVIGCMADCPFKGKYTSPIQLGRTDAAPSVADDPGPQTVDVANATSTSITVAGVDIPYWPDSGFRWNGAELQASFIDGDGVMDWRSFCGSFVYPLQRIRNAEGEWSILWRAKEKNGDWRQFEMETSQLAATDLMARTFAANEVFLTRNKSARTDMARFAETLVEKLQAHRLEVRTVTQFGWNDDFTGFVIGSKMITKDDEVDILCDPDMPDDMRVDFGTSGTLDEWIANVDTLYNRPGAEPLQFALAHSMGSALIRLFGSSNWHGLPLALTGVGGSGKSTGAKIACGFWGNPKLMERQTGEQGSTLNAAIRRIALMGEVPVLLDEFSGRSPDELTRTGYALANGRDKERLQSNGKFASTGKQWFKNSFITSNDSITETISQLPAGHRVEATQLRFFEVAMPEEFRETVFSDIKTSFVERHMDHVYGTPARPFLRFLMDRPDWVRRQINRAREKHNPRSSDDTKERFYRDAVVTAVVAAKIAEHLGLIRFDVNAMQKWALSQIVRMRASRAESNIDTNEQIGRFVASLPGRLIVTRRFSSGRGRTAQKEVPLEPLRGAAVGRVCTEDKIVYVATQAVADWCKDIRITVSSFREALDKAGYLIADGDGNIALRRYLGAGTTVPSGQVSCYEFSYNKLFSQDGLSITETEDGVTLQATMGDE